MGIRGAVVYQDFLVVVFSLKVAQVKEKGRQGGKEEILTAHTAVSLHG